MQADTGSDGLAASTPIPGPGCRLAQAASPAPAGGPPQSSEEALTTLSATLSNHSDQLAKSTNGTVPDAVVRWALITPEQAANTAVLKMSQDFLQTNTWSKVGVLVPVPMLALVLMLVLVLGLGLNCSPKVQLPGVVVFSSAPMHHVCV